MRNQFTSNTIFDEFSLQKTMDPNFFITRFYAENIGDELKYQGWGFLDKKNKISIFQSFISNGDGKITTGSLILHDANDGNYFTFRTDNCQLEICKFDIASSLCDGLLKIRDLSALFIKAIEEGNINLDIEKTRRMKERLNNVPAEQFPRLFPRSSEDINYCRLFNSRIFGNYPSERRAEVGNFFIYHEPRLQTIEPSLLEVGDQLNQELSMDQGLPSVPEFDLDRLQIKNSPMIQKYLLPRVLNYQVSNSEVPNIEELFAKKADDLGFIGQNRQRFIGALRNLQDVEKTASVGLDNFSLDETSDQQRLELLFDFIMSQYEKINEGQAARSAITSHQINEKISIGIVDGIAESKFFEINFKIGRKDYKLQLQPDSLKYYKENYIEVTDPEAKLLLNESLADIIRDVSRSAPSAVAGPSSVARVASDERFLGGN